MYAEWYGRYVGIQMDQNPFALQRAASEEKVARRHDVSSDPLISVLLPGIPRPVQTQSESPDT